MGTHPHIKFLGYLDDTQFDDVFRSAHVAVLPYLSSGGPSGVAHIAARFALPIVGTNIDDLVRLADEEGLPLDTYDPQNSSELARRLIELAGPRPPGAYVRAEVWSRDEHDYVAYRDLVRGRIRASRRWTAVDARRAGRSR